MRRAHFVACACETPEVFLAPRHNPPGVKHDKTMRSHGFTALGPCMRRFARLQAWAAAGTALLLGASRRVALPPFHFRRVLGEFFVHRGLVWIAGWARAGTPQMGPRPSSADLGLRRRAFLPVSMHWTASPFFWSNAENTRFSLMPLIPPAGRHGAYLGRSRGMAVRSGPASPSARGLFLPSSSALAEYWRGPPVFGGFRGISPAPTGCPWGTVPQTRLDRGVYWLTLLTIFRRVGGRGGAGACRQPRRRADWPLRMLPTFAPAFSSRSAGPGAQRALPTFRRYPTAVVVLDGFGRFAGTKSGRVGRTANASTRYIKMLRPRNGRAGRHRINLARRRAIPVNLPSENPERYRIIERLSRTAPSLSSAPNPLTKITGRQPARPISTA